MPGQWILRALCTPKRCPKRHNSNDFVSADDSVQAVANCVDAEIAADILRAEDANSSSGEDCDKAARASLACWAAVITSPQL